MSRLEILPVEGLPEVRPGDRLATLLAACADLVDRDVVVVTQKVVSKAEGRMVAVDPDDPAAYAAVVQAECVRVLRRRGDLVIAETAGGFVCANAGIDHSNVPGDDAVTLLPVDCDASAERIRARLRELTGLEVGVIVSDTFGRAWRVGIENVALGAAGVPVLVDYRGQLDDHGKELTVTVVAVADELAAAAELVMGKTARVPFVVVRGYRGEGPPGSGRDLVRPPQLDLFR